MNTGIRNCWHAPNVMKTVGTFIWFSLAVLTLNSMCWPAFAQDKVLDRMGAAEITRNFLTVALRVKLGETHESRIRKWAKPLLVTVIGDVSEGLRSSVRIHARELETLSNLRIAVSDEYDPDDGARALSKFADGTTNYVMIFFNGTWAQFFERYRVFWERVYAPQIFEQTRALRLADGAPCFSHIAEERTPGNIRTAFVYIRTSLDDDTKSACIVQEMTQSLGITNNSDAVRFSMFNNLVPHWQLTDQDKLFVEILYDARIEPGMTEAVAAPIVERIVKELTGKQ